MYAILHQNVPMESPQKIYTIIKIYYRVLHSNYTPCQYIMQNAILLKDAWCVILSNYYYMHLFMNAWFCTCTSHIIGSRHKHAHHTHHMCSHV